MKMKKYKSRVKLITTHDVYIDAYSEDEADDILFGMSKDDIECFDIEDVYIDIPDYPEEVWNYEDKEI